jgi:NAD(P)H dehydrogenase (quinone)
VVQLCAGAGRDALAVELCVDRVRPGLPWVQLVPDPAEAGVVRVATQPAGAVTRGECGRLVEEEQLGEAAGLQQRATLPAAELELAGDPALAVVAPANPSGVVVEAAAVPVHEAACRIRNELAERRDAVLQWHSANVASARPRPDVENGAVSIVITGASGKLGRGVVEEALGRVDARELILVTRNPSSLDEYAERGAQVRHGDFTDRATLPGAFAGGKRLLLISTDVVGVRVAHHHAAIDAAVTAGVEFMTYTSILNPVEDNPAGVVPDHRATEEKLRESGAEWAFLRNSIYADLEANTLAAAQSTGKLVTNAGRGRIAYVARQDCAAAAAAVVTGGDHAGKAYEITGPELVDADGRAALFADLIGSPVEVVQLDDESFASGFAEKTGLPIEVGQLVASFGRATREGYFDVVGSDFELLTGRAPQGLRSVLDV